MANQESDWTLSRRAALLSPVVLAGIATGPTFAATSRMMATENEIGMQFRLPLTEGVGR